jgi:MFS family permease
VEGGEVMTILFIILGALLYLFIGGIIAGFLTDDWDRSIGECFLLATLWPLLIAGGILCGFTLLPLKIAEKIKERINKK